MSEFEKTIKLDNLDAQLQSIKGNIRKANTELEGILIESKKALAEVDERERAFRESVLLINAEKEMIAEEADVKLALLANKESELKKVMDDSKTYFKNEFARLDKERNNLIQLIDIYRSEISELFTEKSSLRDVVSEMRSELSVLSLELKKASEDYALAQKQSAESAASLAETRDEHRLHKAFLESEIESLKVRRAEEEAAVVDAREYISKKEKEFARRESDILTVTRRLRQLFNEVRPGTVLKI